MSTMGTSLKDFKKSAGLVACPLAYTQANGNDIRVLGIPNYPNFRISNNKKKKRQSRRRSGSCMIRCHDCTVNEKRMLQGLMYRRQLLLASTSLPLKPQQMMAAMPSPPNLTDYHNLANAVQEAQKFKNSPHGRPEINDVVCWPLKPSNSRSTDELSGVVGVPGAEEQLRRGMNEKEVVTALVRRPVEALKQKLQNKEEEVVLQGIEVIDDKPLCFDVYIKLGQEEEEEEELYAGTFSYMPPRRKQRGCHDNKAAFDGHHEQRRVRRCCLRLGMNGMLSHRPVNAHHAEESVLVKLVPTLKVEDDPIKVESIFIDYT